MTTPEPLSVEEREREAVGAVIDRWYHLGMIRFSSRDDGSDDLLLRDELLRAVRASSLRSEPAARDEPEPLSVEELAELRRFELVRSEDVSGTSGVGVVAEGVWFSGGKAVLSWVTEFRSVAVYDTLVDLERIHGHEGRTVIRWIDGPRAARATEPPKDPPDVERLAQALNESVGSLGWLHLTPPNPVDEWRENARIIAAEYDRLGQR